MAASAAAAAKKSPAKKAAASKKAPAKATVAKKTAKAADADEKEARKIKQAFEPAFQKRVLELKSTIKDVGEIAEKLDVGKGTVMLAILAERVTPSEKVKYTSDEDLAQKVVRLRDTDKVSWGIISARSGVGEGKLRRLYETVMGEGSTRGNRIGKGGRYPVGQEPPERPAVAKKAVAKKAAGTAKKRANPASPTTGLPKPFVEMNLAELQARLDGKVIQFGRNGKTEKVTVKHITRLAKGEMHFSDQKGASRTIKVEDITKAAR